jgi:hypothetical protein
MIASNLISLHQEPAVNNATQFAQIACNLKIEELVLGYENLIQAAPARHERGKLYLTGRTGTTSSGRDSNRREEHLAVALYNASRAGKHFALPDGRALQIVDYQTPLKARQDDKGVGKVDLFAFLGGNLSCVIELKVMGSRNNLGDTPLRALLEGLTYCAIVEANARQIAIEAQREFQVRLTSARPVLAVIAPDDYWRDRKSVV